MKVQIKQAYKFLARIALEEAIVAIVYLALGFAIAWFLL